MSSKIDRKAAMRASLSAEKKDVNARFATADAVLAERPSGLAVAVPTPAVADSGRAFSAESPLPNQQQIVRAPLEKVHENPLNARYIYNPDVVKELAASIATRGQMVPASAIEHPTIVGDYLLIDGHYRKKALASAGQHTIDLVIRRHESDIELYRMSWLLNEERNAQSPLDNAFAWRKLIDKGLVQTENQIAELLGVSLSTVNKTIALLGLPTAALDKMRDRPEKFGVFTGYELTLAAKKLNEPELLELVDRIVVEDLSSRQVSAIRTKIETGDTRKRKETSRQYKIQRTGQQIGSLKEWDSGKVALEVLLPDPKERAALVAELRSRFGLAD
ncbi:parB-like partition protein [Acidovorax delafieldii 2AN]|jgi:ParB family chromosome partitioning protein|uniref:ParB-like partition protein n=1 Tax=Acidovorax delafieldii 2AN TaxID=573060 RepID=C5SZF0_ACIDE|nr:ParB/RepB/Spo0J family partition protein [Acidovorax delafieldii]EER62346.1 parB-like partition protein [Acidovorax delafieldii 2AN]